LELGRPIPSENKWHRIGICLRDDLVPAKESIEEDADEDEDDDTYSVARFIDDYNCDTLGLKWNSHALFSSYRTWWRPPTSLLTYLEFIAKLKEFGFVEKNNDNVDSTLEYVGKKKPDA
jgi:hypothetical protein